MKEFEAYYSKRGAWIFAFLGIIVFCVMIACLIFWVPDVSWIYISIFSVIFLVLVCVFIIAVRKCGVAVQVSDGKLVLYKKEKVEIALDEIVKVSLFVGNGSFDMTIQTQERKYGVHCFIREQGKKKAELITLLKQAGIRVDTFDVSVLD